MNVQDLLESRDIYYIPKGNDFVVRCLNPDHEDKHPSMRIDKITGIFNCFSCHYRGNLFTLYGEKFDQLQLKRESLKKKINLKLAEGVGLTVPKDSVSYIGNWRNIRPETYRKFEAFEHHGKDHVGRIVFPIRNYSGNIVAFNGRHTTGGTPKYMITPHGAKLPLFPVVKPIKGAVILVEGIYDMLNLHDKGLINTVCCFGTNNINEDKLSILKIQGVETIDVFFDGDDAGQKAAANIKLMCEKLNLHSRNIFLEHTDPGELSAEKVEKLAKKLY